MDGGLDGVKTPFGWTVQGNVPAEVCLSTVVSCNTIQTTDHDDVLKQFWLQELWLDRRPQKNNNDARRERPSLTERDEERWVRPPSRDTKLGYPS